MKHTITVCSADPESLFVHCSCGEILLPSILEQYSATLDELNRLAHEHIEAADRAPLIR